MYTVFTARIDHAVFERLNIGSCTQAQPPQVHYRVQNYLARSMKRRFASPRSVMDVDTFFLKTGFGDFKVGSLSSFAESIHPCVLQANAAIEAESAYVPFSNSRP